MTPLLLVHGGWLDRHCWDLLLPFFDEKGIEAHTITLPGSGKTGLCAFRASMPLSASAICDKMIEIGEPVTLLGHSMGGYAIMAAAQMRPELVARLVFLSGWVPPKEGLSMAQFDRKYNSIITGPLVQKAISWKPWFGTIDIDPSKGSGFMCPLASDDARDFLFQNISPQPIRPGFSKVPWSENRAGRIPKAYIECSRDLAIPLDGQRHFQKNAEFEQVVSIASDHCPFVSMPQELADTVATVMA